MSLCVFDTETSLTRIMPCFWVCKGNMPFTIPWGGIWGNLSICWYCYRICQPKDLECFQSGFYCAIILNSGPRQSVHSFILIISSFSFPSFNMSLSGENPLRKKSRIPWLLALKTSGFNTLHSNFAYLGINPITIRGFSSEHICRDYIAKEFVFSTEGRAFYASAPPTFSTIANHRRWKNQSN